MEDVTRQEELGGKQQKKGNEVFKNQESDSDPFEAFQESSNVDWIGINICPGSASDPFDPLVSILRWWREPFNDHIGIVSCSSSNVLIVGGIKTRFRE